MFTEVAPDRDRPLLRRDDISIYESEIPSVDRDDPETPLGNRRLSFAAEFAGDRSRRRDLIVKSVAFSLESIWPGSIGLEKPQ